MTNITFTDNAPEQQSFADAVEAGLSRSDKCISSKFLYDEEGSRCFEAVCELPEYYVTRTELNILRNNIDEIAALIGPRARIVEFGAGATLKIRLLLDALVEPAVHVPVDISRDHLRHAATELATDYPGLLVTALATDFARPFELPPADRTIGANVGFFPGSTIGNFTPEEAASFLHRARDLLEGGSLLIGVDLKKDTTILEAAYNDPTQVSSHFNLNLLRRMRRQLDAELNLDGFCHYATYEPEPGRMAIGIQSLHKQTIIIGDSRYWFSKGERLHTQHAYKFTVLEFQNLVRSIGFTPIRAFIDKDNLFSVHFLSA